jgi:phosphate uptake regulator
MEKRKVQMTGGSSYIITLPKEWIKSMGIKKNSTVEIDINPDGSLLIVPEGSGKKEEKSISIDIDKIENPEFVFRMLVSAYIRGYTSVVVNHPHSMSPEIRKSVRNFVQNAVGLEIIEEDERRIEIKDLLDPSEMPPERTIKRMHILVKNMHNDAIYALMYGKKELLKDMNERDVEIDRLYWLIAHQYNSISCDRKTAIKIGLEPNLGVYYFVTAKTIERIGDHAVRISENAMRILESRTKPKILENIKKASAMSMEIFTNSIDSWLRKDMMSANHNIDSVKELVKYCDSMAERALQERGEIAVSLNNIIESIRRTGEYSADISEMAINYMLR